LHHNDNIVDVIFSALLEEFLNVLTEANKLYFQIAFRTLKYLKRKNTVHMLHSFKEKAKTKKIIQRHSSNSFSSTIRTPHFIYAPLAVRFCSQFFDAFVK